MARRKKNNLPVDSALFYEHTCALARLAQDQHKEFEIAASEKKYLPTSVPLITYVSTATLSIELSLKYHYFRQYGSVPDHHEVLKIYMALDPAMRSYLKNCFDPVINKHPGSIAVIECGDSSIDKPNATPEHGKLRIEKVIKHSANLFSYYRFLAEKDLKDNSSAKTILVGALDFLVQVLSQSVTKYSRRSILPPFMRNSGAKKPPDESGENSYFKDISVELKNLDGSSGFDSPHLAIAGGAQLSNPAKRLVRQHVGLADQDINQWMQSHAADTLVACWCICFGLELLLKGMLERDKTTYDKDHSLTELFSLLGKNDKERSEQILVNTFIGKVKNIFRLELSTDLSRGDFSHSTKLDTVYGILAELDLHYLSIRYSYEVIPDSSDNRKHVYLQHACFVSDSLMMTALKFKDRDIQAVYT